MDKKLTDNRILTAIGVTPKNKAAKTIFTVALAAAATIAFTDNRTAYADNCDSLVLDDSAQDVIIGHYNSIQYQFPLGEVALPTGKLGVCWRDQNGAWNLERLGGCSTSSPADENLLLETLGGDDRVSTLRGGKSGPNWVFAGLSKGGAPLNALRCGDGALSPWNSGFSFGVDAEMGEGADVFFGTPNNDVAESNYTSFELIPNPNPFGTPRFIPTWEAPADNSNDMLCGGGGDDELLGDADDDFQSGFEEWLDGGTGVDFCDGDPPDGPFGAVGGVISDVVNSTCETHAHAWFSNSFFSCNAIENPITLFGL